MGTVAETDFEQTASEFREYSEKMRDPLVVGALLNKLAEERRATNQLFMQISDKLELLGKRISEIEGKTVFQPPAAATPQQRGEVLLSEIDEKLVAFVRKRGRACAEDVQKKFGYKGRNAASARLNALWKQGVLEKKLAGKTAYFEVSR